MNPTKTQAIKLFLESRTHSDLATLYNHDMEVQVNVAQDKGIRVEGDYQGKQWLAWSDGIALWKSFRIPINASSEPHYTDREIKFSLSEHAEGIGMTGWDWKNRVSKWVAYDFDAITGHSERHTKKMSESELQDVRDVIKQLPWTTIRLSTSGTGIHLYVFVHDIPTNNHHEHAALARSILHMLSGITGFDFNSKVDVCGGNMWVWHRKMKDTPGLRLDKQGTYLESVPANWRDHISVVSGRKKRNLPKFVETESSAEEEYFNQLTGQRSRTPLDKTHRELITYLGDNKCVYWWDSDHHMLVTHTIHLKEAHIKLGMKGEFDTLATGSERGIDHNCFAFPLMGGAWGVRRYTIGTAEAKTWEQDGKGWTRCYLNRELDLDTAARLQQGIEHPNGGWHFSTFLEAKEALQKLGATIEAHVCVHSRPTKVKKHKDDYKVIVEVQEHNTDPLMPLWLKEKGFWKRVYQINVIRVSESDTSVSDDIVRHLITESGGDYGWVINSDGKWVQEPLQHIQAALNSLNYNNKELRSIIGSNVFQPWMIVNMPFYPEFPGDRKWNRDAAQFRFLPNPDVDNLRTPTWNRVLEHLGEGLDQAVKIHPWCQLNGIVKGSEYLKCWITSMFKEPHQQLPYLFFYSEQQNTGKSMFHEALVLLLSKGYARVDHALVSQSGFNGEMENIILCTIEEVDLKANKVAYNRIKDWVTAKHINIHKKNKTPYLAINTCHFVQTANDRAYCPVFPGDTRITMIRVEPLKEIIPKGELTILLEKEASDFLSLILKLELPKTNDRLNVPAITTDDKLVAEEANETDLDTFLREETYNIPGQLLTVVDLWDKFAEWLGQRSNEWSKIKMGRSMPSIYPKGRLTTTSTIHYGNITFNKDAVPSQAYKSYDQVLRQENANISVRT